ncbi:MAG: hypothetical protein GXX10_05830 [Clostridiaceae bacterium]|nr:hypothetical protein [Clostridiaceae bacterium]
MSAINGFCEKCNSFKKRHCNGDRNTCMTILFDRIDVLQNENDILSKCHDTSKKAIETLQQENKKLNAALDKAVDMIGESRCPTDFNSRKCSDFENCLHCWKDWLIGGKEDE